MEARGVTRVRVAVIASGGGSNLGAILAYLDSLGDERAADVTLVVSDKPHAGALERARARDIPAVVCAPTELLAILREHAIGLVVLAGYLRFVPAEVTTAFRGRILNIHPSLLPAHGGRGMYGERVHAAVIAAGDRESGATVHFVDEIYDHGAVIAQERVPVMPGDDAHSLARRVLAAEHSLYPRIVNDLARSLGSARDASTQAIRAPETHTS